MLIEKELATIDFPWPNDLPRNELRHQTARGIYARLLNILPGEDWELPSDQLRVKIAPQISTPLISEVVTSYGACSVLAPFGRSPTTRKRICSCRRQRRPPPGTFGGTAHAQLFQSDSPNEPRPS